MSEAVQIALINAIAPALAAVASIVAAVYGWKALKQGQANHAQGEENHKQVNGRMEQLLQLKGAAGEVIGEKREKARADASAAQDPPK